MSLSPPLTSHEDGQEDEPRNKSHPKELEIRHRGVPHALAHREVTGSRREEEGGRGKGAQWFPGGVLWARGGAAGMQARCCFVLLEGCVVSHEGDGCPALWWALLTHPLSLYSSKKTSSTLAKICVGQKSALPQHTSHTPSVQQEEGPLALSQAWHIMA